MRRRWAKRKSWGRLSSSLKGSSLCQSSQSPWPESCVVSPLRSRLRKAKPYRSTMTVRCCLANKLPSGRRTLNRNNILLAFAEQCNRTPTRTSRSQSLPRDTKALSFFLGVFLSWWSENLCSFAKIQLQRDQLPASVFCAYSFGEQPKCS